MDHLTPLKQSIDLDRMSVPAKLVMQQLLEKRNNYVERVMQKAVKIQQMQAEQQQLFRFLHPAMLPDWVKMRYPKVLQARQITKWELDVMREYFFLEIETPRCHLIEGLETMLETNPQFNESDILEDLLKYLLKG